MKVIWRNLHCWLIVSCTDAFRRHLDPGFVSKLFICSLLSLFLIAGSALAASIPRSSTVSLDDPLLKQHGGAAANQVGDYVSSSGGLNGPYRYYIEVSAGTARLVVDIFDADVGMGGAAEANAGRDRTTSGNWTTTANYRFFNPSGTQVATNFTREIQLDQPIQTMPGSPFMTARGPRGNRASICRRPDKRHYFEHH